MSRKWLTGLVIVLSFALAAGASAQVVINEILYDTQGDDDPDQLFTELWGLPGTDLSGWSLVGINGNGGAAYRTVPLSGTIPADGYYVVGNTASVPNVDLVLGDGGYGVGVDWQNAGSSESEDCDGIDLMNGATLVDHICYGACADGHVCTGEGGSNAPDPWPTSGGPNYAIARMPDHQDTDNNGTDWVATDQHTPGAPNSGASDPQQTITVCGDVSGTWSADTVLVTCEVRVPTGATPVIESGVKVLFWAYAKLIVDSGAVLYAVGTPTDSILFDEYTP
ncbi:MAG: hypothetical protein PHI18_09005, partial [bacterium]|nr:hypothetical protein [bacterium]